MSHLVRGSVATNGGKAGFYAVPCTHLKWHFASGHFDPRKSPQCEISRRPFSLATFLRLMRTATNVKPRSRLRVGRVYFTFCRKMSNFMGF